MIFITLFCRYYHIKPFVYLVPYFTQDSIDRVVFATVSSSGVPIDHISFKCAPLIKRNDIDENVQWQSADTLSKLSTVKEELRSAILKMGLLDTQLQKLPEGESFRFLLVQLMLY